ncbi:MAG: 2-succinyl-5-enolpyruvyl-6-hydroxy-3-cyclohexene-1-carboxylic-acid synthase [Actinomycetota bacterium]|nr:2-succinyl-5-enolpyruvyl-6-hydroxy-3-cyclohexene-1-carboxylic-acid synthase [Actinomycetota bacterium]
MNPSTALATALVDELIRCGLRDAVLAPGSRSAPLAMELHRRSVAGDLRLHVRIDERSAAFLALGLAKSGGRPVVVTCTSGTAAAHFHAAVIEADESDVPLLVLTADRPPELRGTGANQTIDQLKLYGSAVRWFCELGVAEAGAPRAGYWRSAAARAWGIASGQAGGPAGPVHLNVPLREPLVPDDPQREQPAGAAAQRPDGADPGRNGRPDGRPWTSFAARLELPWTERGLVVAGDGDYDPGPLLDLAGRAGWPVLAEPSSNARRGPLALRGYQYLLADPDFLAAHRPDVLVSAGRPGLSRGQQALLRAGGAVRHVVLSQGPGRWSDPGRSATDVAVEVTLAPGPPGHSGSAWARSWLTADARVMAAVDAGLDAGDALTEPRLARDLAAGLPDGALLWAASSLPIRDLDQQMAPREGLRVLASRGASGIDGLVSSAIGAAVAHQAAGGGPAVALLGDLALLHDTPGLLLGPDESRPDLLIVVVNNDGGGIFSQLEQAAFPDSFERVFGTPHGTSVADLAAAARLPYRAVRTVADLADELAALRSGAAPGRGIRLAELRTDRAGQRALRIGVARAAAEALAAG